MTCEVYCKATGNVLHSARFRSVEAAIDWAYEQMADYDNEADYRLY